MLIKEKRLGFLESCSPVKETYHRYGMARAIVKERRRKKRGKGKDAKRYNC